ncbi:MAG: hypothetical protein ABR591_16345, partial [Candidatus Velthaea sp.]
RLVSLEQAVHADLRGSPALQRWEASVYSQNGEDGIIMHLFSCIGTTDRRFVEFGVGNGVECNTANLSINFGWTGLLMDADPGSVAKAGDFYRH